MWAALGVWGVTTPLCLALVRPQLDRLKPTKHPSQSALL